MKKFNASVVVIKDDDDNTLLLKRFGEDRTITGWCLPGGKVEAGETPVQCAAREVMEETGIFCHPNILEYSHLYTSETKKYRARISVFILRINEIRPMVTLSEEHEDFIWTRYPEIFPLAGNTKKALVKNETKKV